MGMEWPAANSISSFTRYPTPASLICFPFLFFPPTSKVMPSISKSEILEDVTLCRDYRKIAKDL